jgi:hypothetical protein
MSVRICAAFDGCCALQQPTPQREGLPGCKGSRQCFLAFKLPKLTAHLAVQKSAMMCSSKRYCH